MSLSWIYKKKPDWYVRLSVDSGNCSGSLKIVV
jgi:hypothetical protein